jgi:hypothetical protein
MAKLGRIYEAVEVEGTSAPAGAGGADSLVFIGVIPPLMSEFSSVSTITGNGPRLYYYY